MEDKIIIDLNQYKTLKESAALIRFGAKVKEALYYMFAPSGVSLHKFYVKGSPGDVQLFAAALGSERRYMDSFLKHGLNDPTVLKNRYMLDKSIANFERETGIKWPLK